MAEQPQSPQPRMIEMVQVEVLIVTDWPERIRLTQEWLDQAYLRRATYDKEARTLVFDVFNGGATYTVKDDPDRPGAFIGERQEFRVTTRRP